MTRHRYSLSLVFVLGLSLGVLLTGATRAEQAAEPPKPVLENLLRSDLESAEGLEVIVSLVEIPPAMALPKHRHPGEEFAYVLEGGATLWQDGKEDVALKAGDAGKVPLQQAHTVSTGAEGAKFLVFRVHKKGEPERIPFKE